MLKLFEEFRTLYKYYLKDPIQYIYVIVDLLQYHDTSIVDIFNIEPIRLVLTYVHNFYKIGSIYIYTDDIDIEKLRYFLEYCISRNCKKIYIYIPYISTTYGKILKLVSEYGLNIYRKSTWITMYLTYDRFRPKYLNYDVHILRPENDYHVKIFMKHMKYDRNIELDYEKCVEFLRKNCVYAIVKDDEILSIGYVYINDGRVAGIGGVFTKPEYRGRGLAKTLLSHMCRDLLKLNIIPFLHVEDWNLPALRLYRSLGFTVHDCVMLIVVGY